MVARHLLRRNHYWLCSCPSSRYKDHGNGLCTSNNRARWCLCWPGVPHAHGTNTGLSIEEPASAVRQPQEDDTIRLSLLGHCKHFSGLKPVDQPLAVQLGHRARSYRSHDLRAVHPVRDCLGATLPRGGNGEGGRTSYRRMGGPQRAERSSARLLRARAKIEAVRSEDGGGVRGAEVCLRHRWRGQGPRLQHLRRCRQPAESARARPCSRRHGRVADAHVARPRLAVEDPAPAIRESQVEDPVAALPLLRDGEDVARLHDVGRPRPVDVRHRSDVHQRDDVRAVEPVRGPGAGRRLPRTAEGARRGPVQDTGLGRRHCHGCQGGRARERRAR
mmetsp:Transcript_142596/g.443514  ORF Transcript_142596/g.443514 Transcript_142596/m.443514 type:complete len:332 (-) Transcript_142596:1243-2238(-)